MTWADGKIILKIKTLQNQLKPLSTSKKRFAEISAALWPLGDGLHWYVAANGRSAQQKISAMQVLFELLLQTLDPVGPLNKQLPTHAMKKGISALLLAAGASALLGACNGSPAQQPVSSNQPAPPAPTAAADTTSPATPAAKATVPFVNPTKVGRVLGSQSPSPPASRTH